MADSRSAPSTSDHDGLAHVMPVPVLLAVFAALMVLTALTVAATRVDLGAWNLWIAMGICFIVVGINTL